MINDENNKKNIKWVEEIKESPYATIIIIILILTTIVSLSIVEKTETDCNNRWLEAITNDCTCGWEVGTPPPIIYEEKWPSINQPPADYQANWTKVQINATLEVGV